MSNRRLFEEMPSEDKKAPLKRNPSNKRLEGFLKWEGEIPRQENEQSLGTALRRILEQLGMDDRLGEQHALEIWNQVVGEKISSVTKARTIKNGLMTIEVVNPSWKQELTYLAPDILAKLNRTLGKGLVKRLKFC